MVNILSLHFDRSWFKPPIASTFFPILFLLLFFSFSLLFRYSFLLKLRLVLGLDLIFFRINRYSFMTNLIYKLLKPMHCGIGFTICRLHELSSCITHAGIGVFFLSQKHVSVFLRPIQHTLPCSISFLTCSYLLLAFYFNLCVVLTNMLRKTTRCRVAL